MVRSCAAPVVTRSAGNSASAPDWLDERNLLVASLEPAARTYGGVPFFVLFLWSVSLSRSAFFLEGARGPPYARARRGVAFERIKYERATQAGSCGCAASRHTGIDR